MVYLEAVDGAVDERALDSLFGALADPTRRMIVARLAQGETTIGELARPLPMSLPAVGKHIAVLERARLVERRREGRLHRVRLAPAALRRGDEWLAPYRRFWDDYLDRLAVHLGEPQPYRDSSDTSSSTPSTPERLP